MSNDYTYLKPKSPLSNHEWAKDVRAILADLNQLLLEASGRDVKVTGDVVQIGMVVVSFGGDTARTETVKLELSERI